VNLLDSMESIISNPLENRSRIIDEDGNFGWGNVLDYLDIHRFALRIGLSLADGDDLLSIFRKICSRNSAKIRIPRDMRTIRATIENSTRDSSRVETMHIPYPNGLLDISDIQLVTGYYINPMFMLAEYLLTLRLADLILKPEINYTSKGVPIINHYASAQQFISICEAVSDQHGRDVYPICLSFNYDSMALETTGKRSVKPLKMSVLNISSRLSNRTSNIHTIGFGPDLPYTDNEYITYLTHSGVATSAKRGLALRYIKRYFVPINLINPYNTL
jgi:hypothetical protein